MSLTPVAPPHPLFWHPGIEAIQNATPPGTEVYIVGGAVRDAFLHLPLHDIDLVTPEDGRLLARHIANAFDGAYYPLDTSRGVGRAIITWNAERLIVDVAQLRGPDLLTDLQKRDFTLNAMAVHLTGDLQTIIDPVGGLEDLQARRLRQCSHDSVASDPVRALRAIRASLTYNLTIEPTTRQAIKTYAPALADASPERIRDEFFHILDSKRPSAALRALQHLGLLQYIIPEVNAMQDIRQGSPHQHELWEHTLLTVERLHLLIQVINHQVDDNLAANLQAGMLVFMLGSVGVPLEEHLTQKWPNHRPHLALLILAALLHDAGKPATRSIDTDGRTHFLHHERVSAQLAEQRAYALRLSSEEATRLARIVQHHMRPHWLSAEATGPSRRAIYRFWRDTGPAGVDICLLAMADYLATYGTALEPRAWAHYVNIIRTLLEAYYLHRDTRVAPRPLLKGKHLIQRLKLEPGPLVGEILEHIREAQAAGEISTRQEALDLAQRFLDEKDRD